MEDWKESMLDRLPFYWDGENVESFLSTIAYGIEDAEDGIERVKHTRRLDEIIDGEEIATGINLDKLAANVGQTRDTAKFIDEKTDIEVEEENDAMFRRRIIWNIDLQQSDGLIEDVKDLLARGLKMYRTRTGLGGLVYEDGVVADDFLVNIPPDWDIPEEIDLGDKRYIEPSDIIIFPNQEPRLEMEAPDSYHGKFYNLTNFYSIGIPWEAMPWSDGENSLVWRSQDDFPRPFFTTFTSDDLSNGDLTVTTEFDPNYPVPSVTNDKGNYIEPDSVSVDGNTVTINFDSYNVDGVWSVRLTPGGVKRGFTDSDLNSGILTINNTLNSTYPSVVIYDDSGQLKSPDSITYVNSDTIEVDLGSFTVSNEWVVNIVGGDDIVDYSKKFSQSDLGALEMEVIHALGADSPEVLIVDSNGTEYASATVKEINDDSIRIIFPSSSTVQDEWYLKVMSSKVEIPEDTKHGWNNSVYTGEQEDLHIEPLKNLVELTRPSATDVELYGYGGMIWKSQDDLDDPSNPPKDDQHGWGARFDGDIEETEYAMENLDGFWINY